MEYRALFVPARNNTPAGDFAILVQDNETPLQEMHIRTMLGASPRERLQKYECGDPGERTVMFWSRLAGPFNSTATLAANTCNGLTPDESPGWLTGPVVITGGLALPQGSVNHIPDELYEGVYLAVANSAEQCACNYPRTGQEPCQAANGVCLLHVG